VILVDTSVWVNHLRNNNSALSGLLEESRVLCHPFIIGELACGNLKARGPILEHLSHLPSSPVADHDEVLALIERRKLWGTRIGYVDAHLLASAILGDSALWTADRTLAAQAKRLRIAAGF
jgi:predicted nucleic acid-binding protein